MKLIRSLLEAYADIPADLSNQALADKITNHIAEVEEIIDQQDQFENIVVGQIKTITDHPNADSLKVTHTDVGDGELVQILCGGSNVREGQKVIVAKLGAKVHWHGEESVTVMKKAKIRGEASLGMICAAEEVLLDDIYQHEAKEIVELPADAPVGMNMAQYVGKKEAVIDIDNKSLTHRPDLWGHYGFARDVAAVLDVSFHEKTYIDAAIIDLQTQLDAKRTNGDAVLVDQTAVETCSTFCLLPITVKGVGKTPQYILDALTHSDIKIIHPLVDVTNFVMIELGQPMHAYDAKNISGQISTRMAKDGEKLITLDKEEKTLTSEDMVIVDDNTVIGLAGIMGGMNSGVEAAAQGILMEVAHFDPVSVRKTAKRHGLSTDASKRYEKSLSPQLPVAALLRAVEILQEMYDEVICGDLQAMIAPQKKLVIEYTAAIASHLVGQDIADSKQILERFGFVVDASSIPWKVTVPHFRQGKDINLEMDLVEEVVRAYGYQDIVGIEPSEPAALPLFSVEQQKQRLLTRLMTGLGYDETQTYSFLDASLAESCLQTIDQLIPLTNPLSQDHTHLRSSILPTLLGYVDRSIAETRDIQVFELATVFGTKASPCNTKQLVAIKVVPTYKNDPEVLYDMKSIAESLLEYTKVNTQIKESEHDLAHPYRQCQYVQGKKVLAEVFELHPRIIRNFKWKNVAIGVMIFHPEALNLKSLKKASYSAPSAYPASLQGFSVYFPESLLIGAVQTKLQKISPLVESVTITDYYQGEHTPAGKKAVGIEISYRDHTKTLEEQDVAALSEQAKSIMIECGGEVRV